MKATELRIGNIVTHEDYTSETFEVTEIRKEEKIYVVVTKGGKNGTWDNNVDLVNPVPLTKEWLLKFGFKKKFHGLYHFISKEWRFEWSDGQLSFQYGAFGDWITLECKEVHILQNIYFMLFTEELPWKTT